MNALFINKYYNKDFPTGSCDNSALENIKNLNKYRPHMCDREKRMTYKVLKSIYKEIHKMSIKDGGIWDTRTLAVKNGVPYEEWRKTFDMHAQRYEDARNNFLRLYKKDNTLKILGDGKKLPCPSYSGLKVFIGPIIAYIEADLDCEEIQKLRKENKELKVKLKSIERVR